MPDFILDPFDPSADGGAAQVRAATDEDDRLRALEELERLASAEQFSGIGVPAPPGSGRRVATGHAGGTVYPAGTFPPPDPRTAARGAEDIYGDEGRGGPPAPMRSMQSHGAGRGLATPPQEPVRGPTPRPELLAAMQRQGVGRSPDLGGRGAGQYLANPTPQPPPVPTEPTQPPAEETTRGKLGRLLAARAQAPERDYTGVDVADAVASPFRGLARGLMAAGGMSGARGPTWGEQARARDRQTDADAARQEAATATLAGQAHDRALAERRVGTQERAQEALAERQQSLSETGQAREERTAQIAARALELRETGMESGAALTQARIEAIRSAQAEREALRDPTSPESLRAVDRFGRRVEHIGQVTGRDYDITAEGLAAEDVRAMEQGLSSTRSPQAPRGRGTGGGGPMGRPPWFAGDDAEWGALGATGRRSAILRHSQASGADAEGFPEVIPGSGIRFGGDVDSVTVRQVRQGLIGARSHAAALGTIDRIARERGASATVDPRIEADLVAATQAMMAMVAEMRNTGIINPAEAPTIEAAIPNPTSMRQMTLGEVQRRVNSFRNLLDQRVRAQLSANGVDEAGQEQISRWLRSGSMGGGGAGAQRAAPAGGPQSDMVRVRRPDGSERSVPRRLAERARARGWEVIDGPR